MERRTLLRSLSYARNLLLQQAITSHLLLLPFLPSPVKVSSEDVSLSPHSPSRCLPTALPPDLMTASWDELPDTVLHDAKAALLKTNEEKAGQEALANIFRPAEAVEKFAGILVSLRMELDDSIGLSGEKVGHMAGDLQDALHAAYNCYMTYPMHLALRRYICVRKLKWSWGQR